jgi:DNA-binding winged helix-turn-helix (wHTH) protein/TolB-like protein
MGSEGDAPAADRAAGRRVRFGAFAADLGSGELWRNGTAVPLQDLPFRVLAALVERPGDVVSRGELTARLWGPDTFVDAAAGLNTAVAKLREALGDDAEEPAFIETLPKRGYRFVARVEAIGRAELAAPTVEGTQAPLPAPIPVATLGRRGWFVPVATVAAIAALVAAAGSYRGWTTRPAVRVAVVLFDNETGTSEYGAFSQAMTDATVTALAAEPRLAVIGNAAVLRTARPFRDIATVRDALDVHYVIIGQVQLRDGDVLVRAHLIRAADQAHVGIDEFVRGGVSDTAFQQRVSSRVRTMVLGQLSAGGLQ